jgi:hypothetical protein
MVAAPSVRSSWRSVMMLEPTASMAVPTPCSPLKSKMTRSPEPLSALKRMLERKSMRPASATTGSTVENTRASALNPTAPLVPDPCGS